MIDQECGPLAVLKPRMIPTCRQVWDPLPRTVLGRTLLMGASPATSCGFWAQTARAERERQGHYLATCCLSQARAACGHPRVGRGGQGTSRNPRGSFGGESEPSKQEGSWSKGDGFNSSDGGWDPASWFPVTRREKPCWIWNRDRPGLRPGVQACATFTRALRQEDVCSTLSSGTV